MNPDQFFETIATIMEIGQKGYRPVNLVFRKIEYGATHNQYMFLVKKTVLEEGKKNE